MTMLTNIKCDKFAIVIKRNQKKSNNVCDSGLITIDPSIRFHYDYTKFPYNW